ncbi:MULTISPECIES: PP2C family protein-serine/threonine phosphatase [unclassified Rathayibacter]|uniref:PP2C family protein-serine/threonine phosphatase n=1 Tax=unclassified Rathayibacter TaxID=2609250 RepID=UPI00188D2534|nr:MULTISPECIES: GAF domain-containing SpoIIE family protein phosphatase [unclassified Rathayibacter]MBF4462111.1 SpoIIE family protein phosphatase [Rathayibacter sp. VKM Ac-2879]MBF4503846.1 SpoIIE family protein phosphatase [Rathayibacter sp. VKM Ac-2878]
MSDELERRRLAAVAELGLGAASPQERFDRITRVARQLLRVPLAEINIVEESTQYTKSPLRPGRASRVPRADSMCDATIRQDDIFVVPDATADPRFAHRGTVVGSPHVRFYAGRPLTVGDGLRVGTLCIIDKVARDLSEEEAQVLDELGRWAERELREIAASSRAAALQERLRPAPLLDHGWSVNALTLPAQDVAGDYASWRSSARGLSIELVDVMGKGVSAAIMAASIRSAFQARPAMSPVEAVLAVNAQLLDDFTATATFATAFVACLDPSTGMLSFVDAGHGLTVLLRADGSIERLASLGLPLGIAADGVWPLEERHLARGDTLFACSDGLLDLYDGSLDALERLSELVRELDDEELFDRLSELVAPANAVDDVTALILRSTV